MKNKKLGFILTVMLLVIFALFAMGSGEDAPGNNDGGGNVETAATAPQKLGKYSVTIDGCRLAKDYAGNPVAIIQYTFTNVSDDEPVSFMFAMDDQVYQNGVGLTSAIIIDDSVGYDSDNQMKEIKKGASLKVEVAYELNDTTTDIEVEVSELFSWNDYTVKKTFKIK